MGRLQTCDAQGDAVVTLRNCIRRGVLRALVEFPNSFLRWPCHVPENALLSVEKSVIISRIETVSSCLKSRDGFSKGIVSLA